MIRPSPKPVSEPTFWLFVTNFVSQGKCSKRKLCAENVCCRGYGADPFKRKIVFEHLWALAYQEFARARKFQTFGIFQEANKLRRRLPRTWKPVFGSQRTPSAKTSFALGMVDLGAHWLIGCHGLNVENKRTLWVGLGSIASNRCGGILGVVTTFMPSGIRNI